MGTSGQTSRKTAVALAALAAATIATGCGHASSSRAPHPRPSGPTHCNDLADRRLDGFVLIGSDWSGDRHRFQDSAVVYACVWPGAGGVVRLAVEGHGITVRPARRTLTAEDTGVLAFSVSVTRGASGRLVVRQTDEGSYSGGPGPVVAAGEGSWRFVPGPS